MEHHVYFWLKEANQNEKDRAVFEVALDALLKTPNIGSGGWGKPATTPVRPVTENSYDYGLYLRFDSIEKHDAYQVHPEHDVFIDQCKDFWEKVMVMDVE